MTTPGLAQAVASALADAGADTVFGLPGGGNNLDLISATTESGIRFVLAHGETSAVIMATIYADLANVPGAAIVTRGPGAASAVNGVANAMLDRQQVVLLTDCVSSQDLRIAHQRIDQPALFTPVTKWSATVGQGDSHGAVRRAIEVAHAAPRGPVHLDLDPAAVSDQPPALVSRTSGDGEWDAAVRLVRGAKRPVVVLGVGARVVVGPLRGLLADRAIPVLMTYRAKGAVPDSWTSAAGLMTGATSEAPVLAAADLILMIGVDSVEFIPAPWAYAAPVVALSEWNDPVGYYPPAVQVVGDLGGLLEELAPHMPSSTWAPGAGNDFRDTELQRLVAAGPGSRSGAVRPYDVVEVTRGLAAPGTIATIDAGAHMLPAMALWTTEDIDEVVISSGLATMGFALPAAIGAALARPGRRVVCFTGDGGLGMCVAELETVVRLDLPVTVVVFNDARLSLIAAKAKPDHLGTEEAIAYAHTDFSEVAQGFGMRAQRVESASALRVALQEAFDLSGPTLLDVIVDASDYPAILDVLRGERPEDERA